MLLLSFWITFLQFWGWTAPPHEQGQWTIDSEHTTFQFRARHMGLTEITGRFHRYNVKMSMEEDNFLSMKMDIEIETKSLDSQLPARDEHLRGKDFFDVTRYPTMRFKSRQIIPGKRKNEYEVVGDLTVKSITRPVTVSVRTGKTVTDLKGRKRMGFAGFTVINRHDFGMDFDIPMEDGVKFISDEVNIDLGMEFVWEGKGQ